MTDRLLKASVLGVLAIAAAGCGSSSHSSSTASAQSSTSGQPSTEAQMSGGAPVAKPKRKQHRKRTQKRTTTSTSTTEQPTTDAPPPTPSGTPAAPAGLSQTTGYGTYELCSGTCSGAVPASLRRPLHIPHSCTVGGSTPVKPLGGSPLVIQPFISTAWSGARVTWRAAASYKGPILIRGRQVGGSGAVGFGEGHTPYDELQLLDAGQGAPSGSGRAWLTFTRVKGPGCYAYQVDGTSFSDVIVFRAAK
jgi:hypothetical protein